MHVQALFKDAPELLAEFKDFLPEALGSGMAPAGVAGILPQPVGGSNTGSSWGQGGPSTSGTMDKVVKKQVPPSKRRKRPADKDLTPVPPPTKVVSTRVRISLSS